MWYSLLRRAVWVAFCAPLLATVSPRDWVPARWNRTDAKSLDLLAGTPINCLLLKQYTPAFAVEAHKRGVVALAVITPGGNPIEAARGALRAELDGIVLEGDFPADAAAAVREIFKDRQAVIVELTARNHMKLGGGAPVVGTYQGVWPGIQVLEDGKAKAAPSGSPWIDTNSGFIRAVRAWGDAAVWIANLPPARTVIPAERYLQAICDAAMAGARWVVAFDDDLASRLAQRDPAAVKTWQRMARHLAFFEKHPEWRAMRPYGKLALVQDPEAGALLSGGILDMIAAKHTPVRPVPRQRLAPGSLAGATMAVDVDPEALTPEQREILKQFTRSGGTLLTGPPGWKAPTGQGDSITLEKAELERLNDIWHDVQSMVGRRNLGARLFNVSSMLSSIMAPDDGKTVVIHLVNYSSYPVENVAVHMLGNFKHARLLTPEGIEKDLETYTSEEGTGVDVDQVSVLATLRLD